MTKKFPIGRKSRTPGGDGKSPMEAVSRLVEERGKYEQWLEELEAKKDSTPPKVFDRVRHDYLARLQTVMDELKEHTATLQEHAANLVAKLRELEAKEQAITDELAETELRAQVGEITEAEWEATSRKAQREVAKLKENQELIADELIRIRDILSDDDDEDVDEEDEPRTSADFDELEFLKSVVGPGSTAETPAAKRTASRPAPPAAPPAQPVPAAPKPATPASAPAVRRTPSAGSPAAPKASEVSLTSNAPTAPIAPSGGTPTPGSAPAARQAPAPAPPAEQKRPAEAARPDNALGLRSSDVTNDKTLKCAECGSMNYPSEWYCERCGAELAQI